MNQMPKRQDQSQYSHVYKPGELSANFIADCQSLVDIYVKEGLSALEAKYNGLIKDHDLKKWEVLVLGGTFRKMLGAQYPAEYTALIQELKKRGS